MLTTINSPNTKKQVLIVLIKNKNKQSESRIHKYEQS
ncbi:hypothetical protein Leryth_004758 [Lithospermum erythrorhizon]|nr:hypothetical protein Leryth_004758 [Lithospermum erythrorhizon]